MRRKKVVIVTILTGLGGLIVGLTVLGAMVFNGNAATKASNVSQSLGSSNKLPPAKPETMNTDKTSPQTLPSSSPSQSPATKPEKPEENTSSQSSAAADHLDGPAADVIWSLPAAAKAVFITIDDGWYPNDSVLAIMHAQHVPISAFLIENAAKEHPDFWRSFVAAGGDIENHTVSHPDLTKDSSADVLNQIKNAEGYLTSFSTPTLFRPPYGDYNQTVCQAAYQAGIKHLIMWNATMSDSGLQTYNGKPLAPGSVILLHWNANLGFQLQKLLNIIAKQHLGVASLPYALNHPNKFPIIWPKEEAAD
ncbi:polysaccharide deacetylase family protein [Desulfosporosinus sp. FKA]|uniref:polysaccharide deacetylase family protein n=1 Tax=Desulfosporosinus sp. FKA TaxID=1969834 RepID=UPI000B4A1B5F|nr:polysaccharide deacetylase family protein [Desulfosporosinus sp. FKA]